MWVIKCVKIRVILLNIENCCSKYTTKHPSVAERSRNHVSSRTSNTVAGTCSFSKPNSRISPQTDELNLGRSGSKFRIYWHRIALTLEDKTF